MVIFGPLVRPRTSADTATLASAAASVVTVSPSTTRTADSATVSPTASVRLSISMTSPTATFCWVPPLRTIAYTVDLTLCWIGSSVHSVLVRKERGFPLTYTLTTHKSARLERTEGPGYYESAASWKSGY